jgi:DNA-binding CsgD family transcriptional regulator
VDSKIFKEKFEQAFQWYGNKTSVAAPALIEMELYKKFWDFFQIGDSYYFIINHNTLSFEFVSKEITEIMGYFPSEFDIPFSINIIHPEDRVWFLSIGQGIIDFFSHLPVNKLMKYKVRYDIRMQKKNGEYARVLYQGILLEHDTEGKFLKSLCIHTDISFLEHEGKPVLSFIGMDDEPSFRDVAFKKIFIENREDLTDREKEVLKLIIEGKLSKEIGSILKISKQTVDTHRKNMLRKKNLTNTGELIGKAIRLGWI